VVADVGVDSDPVLLGFLDSELEGAEESGTARDAQ
jgi:hypothetical protein